MSFRVLLEKKPPDLVSKAIGLMLELSVGYVGDEMVVALAFVELHSRRRNRPSIVAFGQILFDCLNAKDRMKVDWEGGIELS